MDVNGSMLGNPAAVVCGEYSRLILTNCLLQLDQLFYSVAIKQFQNFICLPKAQRLIISSKHRVIFLKVGNEPAFSEDDPVFLENTPLFRKITPDVSTKVSLCHFHGGCLSMQFTQKQYSLNI